MSLHDFLAVQTPVGGPRKALFLFEIPGPRFGKVRNAHEADVVAAMRVLVARVAQTYDKFHGQVRIIRKGLETQADGKRTGARFTVPLFTNS